ncbi:MAG: alpha/beta fold hydrolase [Micropruina sp.]|nr:alpha/beta fold hydrolase [Micropruina sp.]
MKAAAPWVDGFRPGAQAPFDLGRAADAALAQLNRFGLDSMALCGLSLGAVVATEAAIRSPDAVSHLVLAGGQVKPPKLAMAAQSLALRAMPAAAFADSGIGKPALLETLRAIGRVDFRASLVQITARTLVLCGEQDKANLPAAEQLAAGIRGARLELIPGAGASVFTEAPAVVNELLYDFLS